MEISLKCAIGCPKGTRATSAKNGDSDHELEHDVLDKVVHDWKPPQVPLYDVFHKKPISFFPFGKSKNNISFSSGYKIKTLEKTVSIHNEGQVEFELLARNNIYWYEYVHVGLVQVGVKPLTRNALNTSVLVCVRDGRMINFKESILGTMESSLCDGPVYFNCYPNYSVPVEDALDTWKLYVRTQNGNIDEDSKDVAVVYRVYYKVMSSKWLFGSHSKVPLETKKKTFIQTNLLKDRVAVTKTMEWDSVEVEDDA